MRDLTVIVPTLNEAAQIGSALDALKAFPEVIVADGGSTDRTRDLARAHRTRPRVITARGGRAAQLNAGARAATGDILVFVHADSRLPPGAADALRRTDPAVVGGNFALRFDGGDRFARGLTRVYAIQRRLGFYYGDSSPWCRRAAFDALQGFRPVPIMDDYDFVRRLERHGPTTCLPGPATTSDRRWRAIGIPRTLFAWVAIRWLYVAGVPPRHLQRLYSTVR